jgi:hypothetical protein
MIPHTSRKCCNLPNFDSRIPPNHKQGVAVSTGLARPALSAGTDLGEEPSVPSRGRRQRDEPARNREAKRSEEGGGVTQQTLIHLKPQAAQILEVLRDGRPHAMTEFVNGIHGFTCIAVAQRTGELRRAGYDVRNIKRDGGIAVYQLFPKEG